MAKIQSIVRIKGSIDGVTYTEGVNGKLSKSRTTLSKEKMDSNPNFHVLRLLQSELGDYSRFGGLLRSGVRAELTRIKAFRCVQRLNKLLNAIKKEDLLHAMGERKVATGLQNARGKNLLMEFDFYGRTTVSALVQKKITVDIASGEARVERFNPILNLIYPATATHVAFTSIFIGIDADEELVSTTKSEEVYLPIVNAEADLILQTDGLPATTKALFYVVLVVFVAETNGFRENVGIDSAALTIIEIKL